MDRQVMLGGMRESSLWSVFHVLGVTILVQTASLRTAENKRCVLNQASCNELGVCATWAVPHHVGVFSRVTCLIRIMTMCIASMFLLNVVALSWALISCRHYSTSVPVEPAAQVAIQLGLHIAAVGSITICSGTDQYLSGACGTEGSFGTCTLRENDFK
eukprot:3647891-Amphidinium_carterae.1